MAIKKVIQIVAETAKATKDIKNLFDEFLDKQKIADKQQSEINSNVNALGDTAKKSGKGIAGLAKGFKGVGLAIKAAGIGLVLGLLSTLKDVFMQNQRVADLFATSVETVSIIFNEIVNVLVNVIDKVGKSSDGFAALGKVISGLLTISVTPLKLAFYGIVAAIKQAQLSWEESFFGNKDPKKIKDLTESLASINAEINKAGREAIEAGKNVAVNMGGAISEIAQVVEGVVLGVSDISVKSALALAKTNVNLKNTALIASAEQARLVEIYDRQAEKLRQIRDNELISISERTKANDLLGKVLEKQEKALLAQANLQIAAAQADFNKNKSIENQVALTETLTNKEGILAQIEGFRSEQDVNKNALIKERIDLTNQETESNTRLSLEQKRFNAELIDDEVLRLETLRELLQQEKEIESERLQAKIAQFAEGTQARLDAEIEFRELMNEIDQEYVTKGIDLDEAKIKSKEKLAKIELSLEKDKIDIKYWALDQVSRITTAETAMGKAALILRQLLNAQEIVMEIKKTIAFSELAVAKSTMAVAEGTAQTAKIGFPQNIPMLIGYAAQAVGIIGAINSAVSATKSAGASISGGAISAPQIASPTPAPSFNLVGNNQANQLAGALNQNNQPIQAYVVSRDMTSQQEMDRNIRRTASIG